MPITSDARTVAQDQHLRLPQIASQLPRLRAALVRLCADRVAIQVDAYTWRRYALIEPFLLRGPLRALNVGTGGGIETLRLLARGNSVTTIEIDADTARRTRARIERCGYGDRHVGKVGHVLAADVDGPFAIVLMGEVLEHIEDDFGALRRVAGWLGPSGRLIISTPTASYGMLPGDRLSAHEDGGHVRPGYDGPELDTMLSKLGLVTLRRIYNGGWIASRQYIAERRLRGHRATRLAGYVFGLLNRPLMPLLDCVAYRPSDQITIASKLPLT